MENYNSKSLLELENILYSLEKEIESRFKKILESGEYIFKKPFQKGDLRPYPDEDEDQYVSLRYEFDFPVLVKESGILKSFYGDTWFALDVLDYIERENAPEPSEEKFPILEFNNSDIVITDPCYVLKDSDWRDPYGYDLEEFGIKNYLTHSTIYGDWSCTVFDTSTNNPIGYFCADAGLVGVFDLKELEEYNPGISKWISEHPHCATVIKNYTGPVSMKVIKETGVYTDTTKYHKSGEAWIDYNLIVFGDDFESKQTGL